MQFSLWSNLNNSTYLFRGYVYSSKTPLYYLHITVVKSLVIFQTPSNLLWSKRFITYYWTRPNINATLVLQENWLLPNRPLPQPFKRELQNNNRYPVNEAWMIKEPRRERLSDTADSKPFPHLFSSVTLLTFSCRQMKSARHMKRERRGLLSYRMNLKKTFENIRWNQVLSIDKIFFHSP